MRCHIPITFLIKFYSNLLFLSTFGMIPFSLPHILITLYSSLALYRFPPRLIIACIGEDSTLNPASRRFSIVLYNLNNFLLKIVNEFSINS